MAILGKTQKLGRGAAWLLPGVTVAILVALTLPQARAQEPAGSGLPELGPPPSPVPETAPVPAPAAAPASPGGPALVVSPPSQGDPAADVGHFTLETGPLFPVAGGLEHHLSFGWTAAVLGREIISSSNSGTLFAEFGIEYETMAGRSFTVNTDVTAALPTGATQLLTGFNQTRLVELDHLGLRGGFGWTWDPSAGDGSEPANVRPFLIGRIGLHGGAAHAALHEKPTSTGLSALSSFETTNANNRAASAGLLLSDAVDTHEPYVGFTTSLGVGLAWHDASLGRVRLGTVSMTAEVELGYEWNNLGQFEQAGEFLSVSPKVTLGFSF